MKAFTLGRLNPNFYFKYTDMFFFKVFSSRYKHLKMHTFLTVLLLDTKMKVKMST